MVRLSFVPGERRRSVAIEMPMDATVQLLYDYDRDLPQDAYDCACALFEIGLDAPILRKMVVIGNGSRMDEKDIGELLSLIDRPELEDFACARREFEAHLNREYFDGHIDGWCLIQQCCDLYWDTRQPDRDSCNFWCGVADDADQHGGYGCIAFPFDTEDFDSVLRNAILEHQRPMAERATEPRDETKSPRLD